MSVDPTDIGVKRAVPHRGRPYGRRPASTRSPHHGPLFALLATYPVTAALTHREPPPRIADLHSADSSLIPLQA